MTVPTNKAAARSYFEKYAELSVADVIFHAEVQLHYPLGELIGLDAVKSYITGVRAAFPDIRFSVDDLFGEGDLIAARWALTATQTGEFRGRPPTGRSVAVSGNTVFKFRDGKIVEMWVAFDPARLL